VSTTTSLSGVRTQGESTKTVPAESLRGADGRVYGGWSATLASLAGLALGPSSILVFCFATFVPALEREFKWGIGAISFGATLVTIMIIVTSIVAGHLCDRIGSRRMILWSIPLFGAGVAGLSTLSSSIGSFYALLALASIAAVGVWPVTYNKITATWFDRHLGLSLGIANAGIGIGAALLPALASYVIASHGWRSAYLALGVIAVALPWPVAFFFLKERPKVAAHLAEAERNAEGLSFAEIRRTRAFWLAVGGFFVLGAASSSVVVHQVRILVDSGLSLPRATAMQSVLGIALIAGRVCTGWLLDRFRAASVMAVICMVAAVALLLLAFKAPWGSAPLCAVLVGFVIGAEFDVLAFMIPRYFGRRAFGMTYGVIYAVFQTAAGLAIALLGMSRGITGSYFLGLSVVAAMLVVGGILFQRLGPYRFASAG
jgi:MFS family permease